MTSQIHPSSANKIKELIKKAIINPEFTERFSQRNHEENVFYLIEKELNKRKIEFKIDYCSCLIIFENIKGDFCKDSDLVSDECVNKLAEDIFTFYASTPIEYNVLFHFRQLIDLSQLREFPSISLSVGRESTSFLLPDEYVEYAIVNVSAVGYYSGWYPESFMKVVLQKLNVLLFLMEENSIITRYPYKHSSQISSGLFKWAGIEMPRIEIINKNTEQKKVYPKLSDYIEKYYDNYSINEGAFSKLGLDNAFDVANSIICDNSKESLRIKAAIDWLIYSRITEDDTMSFIQICMGLEAIFGDDDYEGSLTTILSDRCAYLIGKNIKDRSDIKKMFREIYQIRSKIIHGVRSYLSENDAVMLHMARSFLRKSILKELGNLGLLSPSQQR
ncbi:hypothetical protein HV198_12545 [Citrobacter freundii]|uniref:HEPN domain-containing protein n=1 Tax=Citrobacter freundii TaxID=546 RepID=UPI0015E52AFE|nr:HEPN domain-containing protein [Citrobacter freundii]QLO42928.1 hypothetical protein HV215_12545 [Citrobacter freundii]QLV41092.1 hypothetical protein HV198_12545 [Citrobacter freundii]